MVARVATVAFRGMEAVPVDVQVHMASGIVAFSVVGLGDKAVGESRERVRAALSAIGLALPAKRITVNLAPADLPKEGSHYDLPIAVGLLTAMGILPADFTSRYLVLGEARAATNSTVPFTQVTLNSIDSFLRIYDEEPWVTNSVSEYDFVVTADGAQILTNTSGASTFYVDYKKRWEGDYNSTTNQNVPLEFFHYGAHGAFADFLRYDGQNEKAAVEDAYAEGLLVLELENAMNQRNSNRTTRFRSHATAQSRF